MASYSLFRSKFLISICNFSTAPIVLKEQLKNAKKFKPSSQNWLNRQLNDSYVKLAKIDHYRCRSAFKLLEINKSYRILKLGQAVVDLGCAPGSWTQVAVKSTNANIPGSGSLVVGVDLSPVHPIEGATLLGLLDFTKSETQRRVVEALDSRSADVVMSDMAPKATGIRSMDHNNIIKLCYAALSFALQMSSLGGTLVLKVLDGGETKKLKADIKNYYEFVRIVRPNASRSESSEMFLVCLNFQGRPSEPTSSHCTDYKPLGIVT